MAKKKRGSQNWGTQKGFPAGPAKGFQKKGTIGVRKGMR